MKLVLLTLFAVVLGIGLFFIHKLLPYIVVGGIVVAFLYFRLSRKRRNDK